jgi:hypothetical protein
MHLATILSTIVVLVFIIRLSADFFNKKTGKKTQLPTMSAYFYSFFSAVLFVNALAHFTHGISGESFAGPYKFLFSSGVVNHLANVIWGFVNIVLGYLLFVRSEPFSTTNKKATFFIGILAMGIFLCLVFSH